MKAKTRNLGHRKHKVAIPREIRVAVSKLCETMNPDDHRVGRTRVAFALGIATCTIDEVLHPQGMVQPITIEKIRAKLAELEAGRKSA